MGNPQLPVSLAFRRLLRSHGLGLIVAVLLLLATQTPVHYSYLELEFGKTRKKRGLGFPDDGQTSRENRMTDRRLGKKTDDGQTLL